MRTCTALLLPVLLLPALTHAQAPPLTLTSPNPEDPGFFGTAVSGVPDADGDGRGDLLVGADGEDGGAAGAGRAYLFSGATGARLRTLSSPNPEAYSDFGSSVSGVPDTDGDGRGDLLVGAYREDGGAEGAGRAYLFSGATGALLRTLTSPNFEDDGRFGYAVSGVADADGDGRGDLLIGANDENGGAEDAGRAYLFSGATGVLVRTIQSPNPERSGDFGTSVSEVADADGDGRGDLLIGAYQEDGGAENAGRAYLFSGATGALLRTLTSPNPGTGYGDFGTSVSGVPDADGDGRSDLLVGATDERVGEVTDAGRAYLFSGATGALLQTLQSPQPETWFGISVSGVSDFDGDGRGDLLIGASYEDGGGATNGGRAYLFSGATGARLRTITSPNPQREGYFGTGVAGTPDADGDGRGDLFVGADGEDVGAENAGRAHLFPSGSSNITVSASGDPATIPPGGTLTVTVTASNANFYPVPLDLWIVATRNGNALLTQFVGFGTLPAGATGTGSFSLTAPSNTRPGLYTLAVNVGDFPNTVYASDAFDVTVTGERLSDAPSAEPFVVELLSGGVFAADALTSSAVSPQAGASTSSSVSVSPNPFSGRTALGFTLDAAGPVRLAIHDVLGREVAVLVDRTLESGQHTATFDGRGLASGIYVWRLAAGGAGQTGRLTLIE